ncbi:hypothetical protein HYH03_015681 [Edaphochlamys debaryana]|uniref:Uncharacterized protein n=1 Tax=Edaphochlamys debaryana TaxID=47281 RepID=A0A835XMR3_9CHLO|nr:hypothetical protein HYH03_015681 [Edaphochlamys debaryana]|eukprot:KAG2485618.1 hypothetical protein HYH03_015681 [Edaphochlamys debaryana]
MSSGSPVGCGSPAPLKSGGDMAAFETGTPGFMQGLDQSSVWDAILEKLLRSPGSDFQPSSHEPSDMGLDRGGCELGQEPPTDTAPQYAALDPLISAPSAQASPTTASACAVTPPSSALPPGANSCDAVGMVPAAEPISAAAGAANAVTSAGCYTGAAGAQPPPCDGGRPPAAMPQACRQHPAAAHPRSYMEPGPYSPTAHRPPCLEPGPSLGATSQQYGTMPVAGGQQAPGGGWASSGHGLEQFSHPCPSASLWLPHSAEAVAPPGTQAPESGLLPCGTRAGPGQSLPWQPSAACWSPSTRGPQGPPPPPTRPQQTLQAAAGDTFQSPEWYCPPPAAAYAHNTLAASGAAAGGCPAPAAIASAAAAATAASAFGGYAHPPACLQMPGLASSMSPQGYGAGHSPHGSWPPLQALSPQRQLFASLESGLQARGLQHMAARSTCEGPEPPPPPRTGPPSPAGTPWPLPPLPKLQGHDGWAVAPASPISPAVTAPGRATLSRRAARSHGATDSRGAAAAAAAAAGSGPAASDSADAAPSTSAATTTAGMRRNAQRLAEALSMPDIKGGRTDPDGQRLQAAFMRAVVAAADGEPDEAARKQRLVAELVAEIERCEKEAGWAAAELGGLKEALGIVSGPDAPVLAAHPSAAELDPTQVHAFVVWAGSAGSKVNYGGPTSGPVPTDLGGGVWLAYTGGPCLASSHRAIRAHPVFEAEPRDGKPKKKNFEGLGNRWVRSDGPSLMHYRPPAEKGQQEGALGGGSRRLSSSEGGGGGSSSKRPKSSSSS